MKLKIYGMFVGFIVALYFVPCVNGQKNKVNVSPNFLQGMNTSPVTVSLNWKSSKLPADLYINSKNKKFIQAKDSSGITQDIFSVNSIPKRKNLAGESLPYPPTKFTYTSQSPDKAKMAFSVSSSGDLDPGFIGIVDLSTKQLIQIPLKGSGAMSWSPDGKYIALVLPVGLSGLFTIEIYDTIGKVLLPNILPIDFLAKQDINTLTDLKWSKDGQKIYFKGARVNYNLKTKKKEIIREDLWAVGIDGSELNKLK